MMDRREFVKSSTLLFGTTFIPTKDLGAEIKMNRQDFQVGDITLFSIDHIPAIRIEPKERNSFNKLIIWINHFGGEKEKTQPFLLELASKGYVAISLDAWQHGQRKIESKKELASRVFGQFRQNMWPIIGQTALDVSKVIDWSVENLAVSNDVYIGGVSMGGDIAVAAAGIDHRIKRVAVMIATPDWMRPGMKMNKPSGARDFLDQGEANTYSNFFYKQLSHSTGRGSYCLS